MSFPSPKEFYDRYMNDPEAAKRAAYDIGGEMGTFFIEKLGVKESNLEAVAVVLNEFQRTVQGDPNAAVEGGRVTMRCTGFCPIMRTALTLNLPWEWLDINLAWPMIRGIVSKVKPGISLTLPLAKSRGDPACIYVFEEG